MNYLLIEEWNDDNLVRGCQSIAHIEVEIRDESLDENVADAKMVQGLQGFFLLQ